MTRIAESGLGTWRDFTVHTSNKGLMSLVALIVAILPSCATRLAAKQQSYIFDGACRIFFDDTTKMSCVDEHGAQWHRADIPVSVDAFRFIQEHNVLLKTDESKQNVVDGLKMLDELISLNSQG